MITITSYSVSFTVAHWAGQKWRPNEMFLLLEIMAPRWSAEFPRASPPHSWLFKDFCPSQKSKIQSKSLKTTAIMRTKQTVLFWHRKWKGFYTPSNLAISRLSPWGSLIPFCQISPQLCSWEVWVKFLSLVFIIGHGEDCVCVYRRYYM